MWNLFIQVKKKGCASNRPMRSELQNRATLLVDWEPMIWLLRITFWCRHNACRTWGQDQRLFWPFSHTFPGCFGQFPAVLKEGLSLRFSTSEERKMIARIPDLFESDRDLCQLSEKLEVVKTSQQKKWSERDVCLQMVVYSLEVLLWQVGHQHLVQLLHFFRFRVQFSSQISCLGFEALRLVWKQ